MTEMKGNFLLTLFLSSAREAGNCIRYIRYIPTISLKRIVEALQKQGVVPTSRLCKSFRRS